MIKTTKDGREISSEEFRSMWSAELRSGKYVQGKGLLHNKTTGGMCCLGVGCALYQEVFGDLAVQDQVVEAVPPSHINTEFAGQTVVMYDGCATVLPVKVAAMLNITKHGAFKQETSNSCQFVVTHNFLTGLNDKEDKTFAEIADVIETQEFIQFKQLTGFDGTVVSN